MEEMTLDKCLHWPSEYIANGDLNYVGGKFEREDTGQVFELTVAKESACRILKQQVVDAKRQAITELLEQHKKDRAKVSSKSDLINMSTVKKYLDSLCD